MKLTANRETKAMGKSLKVSNNPNLLYEMSFPDNCRMRIPIQFKTIEKIRKLILSGRVVEGKILTFII